MTIIYLIAFPILILIVWMIIKRKWKALLWTVGSLVVLIMIGGYFFLKILSEAFGTECEINRKWKIEKYEIVEKKCIGFAGPHYYPVYLYKDNKIIDQLTFIPDSTCLIKFKPEGINTLTFNICENKLEK